jgi:predicted kinase
MNHTSVVMMAGLPGTGKSTLATALAKQLGFVIIDKDRIHSAMIAKGWDKTASAEVAYEVAFWLLDDLVNQQEHAVIFDSAGRQPFIFARLQAICAQHPTPLKVIHCRAATHERSRRLSLRPSIGSQLQTNQFTDAEDYAFYAYLPDQRFIADTTHGVAQVLPACVTYLQT